MFFLDEWIGNSAFARIKAMAYATYQILED